jgi:hypothetical protein
MRNIYFFICLVITIEGFGQHIKARPSNRDAKKQFKTDVFILNSCSPEELAFRRFSDDSNKSKTVPTRKLSINENRFSAFKVININPLRYNYYLNNEFVSQFLDEKDQAFGDFKRDTANLPQSEIEVLQIFNFDTSKNTTQKQSLSVSKRIIENYKDSLSMNSTTRFYNQNFLAPLIDSYQTYFTSAKLTANKANKDRQRDIDSATKVRDEINNNFERYKRNIENEFTNYLAIIESLTINNDADDILSDILKRATDVDMVSLYTTEQTISNNAKKTIEELKIINKLIDKIPPILSTLNEEFPDNFSLNKSKLLDSIRGLRPEMDAVKKFASNRAFSIDESVFQPRNLQAKGASNSIEARLEIYKIEEFAGNEKMKLAESFILFASLQIGKLLQNEVINNSRFQNQLNKETCLCDRRKDINILRTEDSTIYRYIQDVSASLNVLIKYLELNNPAFNSTVTGINADYQSLLKFLKTFDFVAENNTKEFTLPVHNNYKNVDLIKYSIERQDRLRGRVEPYTYDVWIKGGIKIDFSVAILMSQLKDYTYNKAPYFVKAPLPDSSGSFPVIQSVDSFLIKKSDDGKYNFSFGGMVNVLWRTGASWITPGASFGIAYGPATNSKLQFLGAGSLQFGKSERIIAHFGLVAGESQRLDLSKLTYDRKAPNDNGNSYLVRGNFASDNPVTIPVFVFKPFFGISYNLSNNNKNALNAVGSQSDTYKNAFPQAPQ